MLCKSYIKKNLHSMIKSCYESFYIRAKKNHAIENHVRRGIASSTK